VWVRRPAGRAVAVRYAVEGDALVCLGDGGLAEIPAGTRVEAAIHEIHNGPPLALFSATLRELDSATVPDGLLSDVIGHRDDLQPREHRLLALDT
jgi:hypothetical protein